MARLFVIIIALACATVVARAQPGQPEALALVNAHVVNVIDGSVQRGVTVMLRGGRIESVGAAAAPAGVKAIDVRQRFVVPGLIDAHVHIGNLRALRTALESGVTTARSAGVSYYADVGIRELVKKGALTGPEIVASGYHVRTLIAEEAFVDHPSLADLMRGATTPESLKRVVEANLSRGVDWIKVNATERAGTPDTDPRKQMFTEAELRVIVETAAAKNVPVQAHAHGAEGALAAVKAGVRSIEHGTYLTDEALQLMAKQGTYFDPTMEAMKDLTEVGGDYDHRDLMLRGRHMLPNLRDAIARADKMGVRIVAGSDTGYGPASIARLSVEVANLVDSGLSTLAALQAATLINAQMLRREKDIGQVAPGFEADLIVVERNPLENVSTLQDPLLVISNGRIGLDRLNFGR
ncbi:MAG TPA: amidohydrolase family protein [Vicinamibacterales bacterium]|nr:amidohydrolase family protein [Vicinamibacterales bacterium]